jgi:F420-non-reducing hydrogenase iron-sulfur subunit
MGAGFEFKPRVVGFLCNWCCYAGADLCGVSRFQYPPYIRIIRLMCSGRVDLAFVLRAFWNGADGVFVGGCWPGECHYVTEGNYDALAMVTLGKRLLGRIGVNPERLRIEWVSASEGIRFAEIMNDFANRLKKLGPLGKGEGLELSELKSMLEGLMKAVPYIKLAEKERLARHLRGGEGYEGLFTAEEVDRLFREMPRYYIDPERCQACMICLRRCPADAIDGGKDKIHVIEQDRCIRCGTCMEACPPRFAAVKRIVGALVPPPPPEGARGVMRRGKER